MKTYISVLMMVIMSLFSGAQESNLPSSEIEIALEIVSPSRAEITLGASVSQPIDQFVFLKNEEELGKATLEKEKWALRWNTVSTPDGTYRITGQATVGEKKIVSAPFSLLIDNTPPIVKMEPFVQKTRSEVLFKASVSENLSGVEKVTFTLDQKEKREGKEASGLYEVSWDLPESGHGYHLLEVEASDKAGNVHKISDKVRLDRQGPRIQVLAPLAQGASRGPLSCEVSVSDPAGVSEIDFSLKENTSHKPTLWQDKGKWGAKWDGLKDGLYHIVVTASDQLENKNSVDIYTQIDQTVPSIEWITPKENVSSNKPIEVQVSVADQSTLLGVSLVEGNNAILLKQQGETWVTSYEPSQEGKYSVKIQAKDSAGNLGESKPLTLVYDKTPPKGSLSFPKMEYFSQGFSVEVEALDSLSGVEKVTLLFGQREIELKHVSPEKWSGELTLETSGAHTLSAVILDKAGNQTELPPMKLEADKEPPVIALPDVPARFLLREEGKIAVEVKDSISGVKEVYALLDEKRVAFLENPGERCEIVLKTNGLPEGKYSLVLEAVDKAGNKAKTAPVTVLVDRTPPEVSGKLIPEAVQIGVVKAVLSMKDGYSGVDEEVKPSIYAEIKGQKYPFEIVNFSAQSGEANLLVTHSHPEGEVLVYVSGIQDMAGHEIAPTPIGKFTIKGPGGAWPLVPQNQAHPVLAAYTKNVPRHLSGAWITASAHGEVKAIEDGTVEEVFVSERKVPGYIRVRRLRGNMVWGYHHLLIGKNPSSKKYWAPGEIVKAGETLGTIPPLSPKNHSYLYLELSIYQQNRWISVDSPLKYLDPKSSATFVPPTILEQAGQLYPQEHLTFEIPPEQKQQTRVSTDYQMTDLLIILYSLLFTGVILSIFLWSRNKPYSL